LVQLSQIPAYKPINISTLQWTNGSNCLRISFKKNFYDVWKLVVAYVNSETRLVLSARAASIRTIKTASGLYMYLSPAIQDPVCLFNQPADG